MYIIAAYSNTTTYYGLFITYQEATEYAGIMIRDGEDIASFEVFPVQAPIYDRILKERSQ